MSRAEKEEMRLDLHSYHARNWRWQREKRDFLEKQRREKEWAQRLSMEKSLQEEQELKNQQANRELWARREAFDLQQQKKLQQQKQEQLLDEDFRKQLEFQRAQRELVENMSLLWILEKKKPAQAQKPHPPKHNPHAPPAPRPLRTVRPQPAKGTMPVL